MVTDSRGLLGKISRFSLPLGSFDLTKSSAVADSFHSHVRRRAVSSGAFFRDHCFCCDVERSRIGPDERIPPIKVYSVVTTHVSSVGNTLEVDIDLSVFKKKKEVDYHGWGTS